VHTGHWQIYRQARQAEQKQAGKALHPEIVVHTGHRQIYRQAKQAEKKQAGKAVHPEIVVHTGQRQKYRQARQEMQWASKAIRTKLVVIVNTDHGCHKYTNI
jgi:hypothetical protein